MRKWVILFVLILWSVPAAAQDEVIMTHGPLSGEITSTSVVLWARANAPGTIVFTLDHITAEAEVTEATDFIAEVTISALEPDTEYSFTVHIQGSDAEPRAGSFHTAPEDASPIRFTFGACLGGQGYCRNPETGWDIFNVMNEQAPDFFLMVGDGIYADSACPADTNIPGAEEVATELTGFRDRYKYHLEDEAYANFLAQTPIYVTWDDHEIMDNFAAVTLNAVNPQMYADGRQAFFEYWPITEGEIYRSFDYGNHAEFFLLDTRSYRNPIVNWDTNPVNGAPKTMLGENQINWLRESLSASDATWKFVVTSVPLSYPTGFPQPQVDGRDGWANAGDRSGYETELMSLLYFIEANDVENVVFLTADTHWPFAISYDPDRDGNVNFYEFGSSPLSALTLPPATIDQTFNPMVMYSEGEFAGTLFNFGMIDIDADGNLTFTVLDREGTIRYAVSIPPQM